MRRLLVGFALALSGCLAPEAVLREKPRQPPYTFVPHEALDAQTAFAMWVDSIFPRGSVGKGKIDLHHGENGALFLHAELELKGGAKLGVDGYRDVQGWRFWVVTDDEPRWHKPEDRRL